MTDTVSDTGGEELFTQDEDTVVPTGAADDVFGECVGDPAVHILESDVPGTILVAVAEPLPDCGPDDERTWEEAAGDDSAGPDDTIAPPADGDLADVVAVRLGGLGPALFFTTGGIPCAPGDQVIVTMEEGQALGTVASIIRMNPEHATVPSGESAEGGVLRPLVRKATDKDAAHAQSNKTLAAEALAYCRQCVRDRSLDMKLVDVLILHDRGKMVFYFTAPARIDFRELVKDLVRRYRTRIELRQIGVRHETQMVGALGNCGMVCCCRRYLRTFAPVAIRMAKEQNVFLNPIKISGICGRLLCCLAYEQEHYDEFYRSCPKLGKKYHTDAGTMRVLRASLFRESVTALSDTGEEVEYSLHDWNGLNPYRPHTGQPHGQSGKKQEPGGPGSGRSRKNGRNVQTDRPDRADQAEKTQSGVEDVPDDMGPPPAVEENSPFVKTPEPLETPEVPDTDDAGGNVFGVADGGSIFGLAPSRQNSGDAPSPPRGGAAADSPGKRKRPHRRGRARKPQSHS